MVGKSKSFDELGRYAQKQSIIEDQGGRCNRCGNPFMWMGKSLDAEDHHKDGNRTNQSRTNREALCPNCHSQTDNDKFKGRRHSESTKKLISTKRQIR